ncbi:MAG TPA: hypothetical protein VGK52_10230 [Polyangia bacterium]
MARLFVASIVMIIGAGACTVTEVVSRPMGPEVTRKIQAAAGRGSIELSYEPVAPLPIPTYSRSVHEMARLEGIESDGTLVFETLQGGETRIPQRDVQSLTTSRSASMGAALGGAAVGIVVGAALGVIVAIAASHPCPVDHKISCGEGSGPGTGGFAIILGIGGGFLGVAIGAEIGAWAGTSKRYEMRP